MEALRRFAAVLAADLRTRFRSGGFWMMLGLSAALTWWCFPPLGSGYIVLGMNGHYRGVYSSAWIGMVLAMLTLWQSLLGFYLVRGTLRHDIESNAWQLLVATPMSRASYLLAKWSSHLLVLSLLLAAGLLVGLVAQAVRAEDAQLRPWELVKPALVIGVPSLALTATCAIWFDMVPWLRRSAGNALYFVLWLAILVGSVMTLAGKLPAGDLGDPRGMALFERAAHDQLLAEYGKDAERGFCLGCAIEPGTPTVRFQWDSWRVSAPVLGGRLAWFALAVLGVAASAPWLDRAAARRGAAANPAQDGGRKLRWLGLALAPLQRSRFGTLLAAELLLMLRQRKLWWWWACLGAQGAQLAAPPKVAAAGVIGAWLLLMDSHARAALREQDSGSAAVVSSSLHGGNRLLLARWMALLLAGAVLTLPAALRFALQAPLASVAIMVIGVSLATWALALAALTRTGRTYEAILCTLAYLGLQNAPVLDVLAAPAWTTLAHLAGLPLAALLLSLSWPRLAHRGG